MPAARNTRRSRRLSNRPPTDPEFETLDDDGLKLLYPEDEDDSVHAPATPPSTCSTHFLSDSDTSIPSSPASEDAKDAPFTPRSSRGRKKKEGHIPRPPNAFMIFRSSYWAKEKSKPGTDRDNRKISCAAGEEWRKLTSEQQQPYVDAALAKKAEHNRLYPDYRYSPVSKKDVRKRTRTRTRTCESKAEERFCQRIAKMVLEGRKANEPGASSHTFHIIPSSSGEQHGPSSSTKASARSSRHSSVSLPRPLRQIRRSCPEQTSVQSHLDFHESFGPHLGVVPMERTPDFCVPCSTVNDAQADQIPHLDLSVSGFNFGTAPFAPMETPSDSHLFNTTLSDYDFLVMLQASMPFFVDQTSPSSSSSNSPQSDDITLLYPDSMSCPTSGLFPSSPDWNVDDWLNV